MTIKLFAGFDLFGAQANAGNTLPVGGAGITGTPYATQFPITVSNTNHLVGVSGLPAHQVGSGDRLRNAVVCHRPAGTSTYALFGLVNGEVFGNGAWSRVYQFTVKDVSTADNTSPFSILTMGTTQVALNAYLFGVNSSRVIVDGFAVSPVINWVRNREYFVEVRIWRDGTEAVNFYNEEVRLDGTVINTKLLANNSTVFASPAYITLGINSNVNITSIRTLIFSDIVVSDGNFIGPHLVLPAQVSAVPATGGWEKDGNASAVTTLNDRDDTTYFISPADNGALNIKLSRADDQETPLRGVQLFVRANRASDAGRALQVKMDNAGGTTIAGPVSLSTTTTMADYRAFSVPGLNKLADLPAATLKISAVAP